MAVAIIGAAVIINPPSKKTIVQEVEPLTVAGHILGSPMERELLFINLISQGAVKTETKGDEISHTYYRDYDQVTVTFSARILIRVQVSSMILRRQSKAQQALGNSNVRQCGLDVIRFLNPKIANISCMTNPKDSKDDSFSYTAYAPVGDGSWACVEINVGSKINHTSVRLIESEGLAMESLKNTRKWDEEVMKHNGLVFGTTDIEKIAAYFYHLFKLESERTDFDR